MKTQLSKETRPSFPKRAVITGGMPYGNKLLHFGHIGGVFVFADVFARFLRDRIGYENVIFVSGTDCYGSPIAESYRKLKEDGFTGTITDFVAANNKAHKETLRKYNISPNIFDGSGLGRAGEIHAEFTKEFILQLYENNALEKITTEQFYDEKAQTFLNGRQVIGRCPVEGCQSSKAYADECDLGHSYLPRDLINPKSTVTGETPVMKCVSNFYYKLPREREILKQWNDSERSKPNVRPVVTKTVAEFLEPPCIYVMNDYLDIYRAIAEKMPPHEFITDGKKSSFTLKFEKLADRECAADLLCADGARIRTGKTLVPFRITGNCEWSLESPVLDGEESTVWVWPESLWAPISFTQAYLESSGRPRDNWKDFWCSTDSGIYQFIGQDNIYFYCVAQPGMFMSYNGTDIHLPRDGELQMSVFAANHHILFLDKKASSSGEIKPPMADDLLLYYTAEQLRMHFFSLGLSKGSVSFMPKPFNPTAKPEDSDPVVKEGFLLNNVYNRIIRTVLYQIQSAGIKMPLGDVSDEMKNAADEAILTYENFMYRMEFHQVSYVLDTFIRKISKIMSREKAATDKDGDTVRQKQWLIDVFHGIRVCQTLLHPIVPDGVALVDEYLNLPESIYNWDNIFKTPAEIFENENEHECKFLEPRFDFFKKHESQLTQM
ncbi:MAG: class I tRNA ligase family protein [Ruminococcus sp.]|nr:class I tRNA ligase family protein [Ruminococcus sp.]